MKPIALQLYSLREQAKKDAVAMLKSVAKMGYKGVETAGLYDMKASELRRIVEDLGMEVMGAHLALPDVKNKNEVLDTARELGVTLAGSGLGPANFQDVNAIKASADRFNFAIEAYKGAGITFYMHNHWWEFTMVDGRLAIDILLEHCPTLQLEIDTYWAANFGAVDPVEQVARLKSRTPLLHIKDGPLTNREAAHTAVGAGKMDIAGVIAAADPAVLGWLIVELDRCDTDMPRAVAESIQYLVRNRLGVGAK